MPSTKYPSQVVQPGPGKIPAGVVGASALNFPSGGGGGAALLAHITDPVDAHMASAIGIAATDPATGLPLRSSVGGPVDGESVLDFIIAAKDLFPPRPNQLGVGIPFDINSGAPVWCGVLGGYTGGFTRGTDVIFTHYLGTDAESSFSLAGMIYPADRGVLCMYYSTDGDFFNPLTTTLNGAVWLGPTSLIPPVVAPGALPSANFNEALRVAGQPNYVPGFGLLDRTGFTSRLPYLKDYDPYANVYDNFTADFFRYQLARILGYGTVIASGDAGSYLLVHWKESFFVNMASIAPANLTLATLVADNCYSSVPVAGDFDDITEPIANLNRRNIFRDMAARPAPAGVSFTASGSSATNFHLSGVPYSNLIHPWNLDIRANNLFSDCYLTGTIPNGALLPAGFVSTQDPMVIDRSDFGSDPVPVAYYNLRKAGTGSNYTNTAAPATGDTAQYLNAALSGLAPDPHTPTGGMGYIKAILRNPFDAPVTYSDTQAYSFNSWPQTLGNTQATSTFEAFTDELYRYVTSTDPGVTNLPIVPTVLLAYNSNSTLNAGDLSSLQVVGGQLVYPQADFSGSLPVGPDYSGVPAADGAGYLRKYIRAFDTDRMAHSTGVLRLRGLSFSAFEAGVFTNDPATDHPGGAIVEVRVPYNGQWLDVGRLLGDPDLTNALGRGCLVATWVDGPDLYCRINTQVPTGDNGGGEFPLFVRVTYINGPGTSLALDQIEWLPPTYAAP